jgi:putative heme-binding domain-containing protein
VKYRALLLVVLCAASAVAQNPFAGNMKEADAGRGLFRIRCAPCHGIRAQGGRGPDLTLGVYNSGNEDKDLFRVISHGVSGTEMPGFGAQNGDENIWRIVTYIRSVATRKDSPPSGDRSSGEKLFWGKGGCGACHKVAERGGPMGPDLTRVGRKRSLTHLRQSVTDPNSDLTPGFYKITVVNKSGQKIVGAQRNFDNFSAQLMTMDGKLLSFLREDVTSAGREYTSLMPAYKSFSEREMNDLLTYLVSLRGEN